MSGSQGREGVQEVARIEPSFISQLGPLLFLSGIFFLNYLSRIILSPLLPTIEQDLKIGHGGAGSLFFLVSLGYCVMLLASGFVSSRLAHRRTIVLSALAVGGALIIVSVSRGLWGIRLGLIGLGLASGLYLPSGIATLTEFVTPKDLGKALAVHELAPNLGLMLAPFFVEAFLGWCSWRGILMSLGITTMGAGLLFALCGKRQTLPGQAPNTKILRSLLLERSFWILIILFSLGIGASLGVYSMVPLYLVSEWGMERSLANSWLGLSRISALGTVFLSGWLADRLGPRFTLGAVFLTAGLLTAMLGIAPRSWIVPVIFLQPVATASFFPPAFAVLSQISSPRIKNVAVSLTLPVAYLLGGGAIPAVIGVMGERSSFRLGFIMVGILLFGGLWLLRFLRSIGYENETRPFEG
jgi:NNP family nitrate/nitrite transporter-like MFS transporter